MDCCISGLFHTLVFLDEAAPCALCDIPHAEITGAAFFLLLQQRRTRPYYGETAAGGRPRGVYSHKLRQSNCETDVGTQGRSTACIQTAGCERLIETQFCLNMGNDFRSQPRSFEEGLPCGPAALSFKKT